MKLLQVRKKLELGSDYHESDEDEEQKALGSDIPKGGDEEENEEEQEEDDDDYYSEEGEKKEKGDEFALSPSFILENEGENVFNPLCYFAALLREVKEQKKLEKEEKKLEELEKKS